MNHRGNADRCRHHADAKARVLTIKPVKQGEAGQTVETIWELGDGEEEHKVVMGCRQSCSKEVQGNHNSFHSQT